MKTSDDLTSCSFCNKHKDAVTKLIVGADVAICNECVELCQSLLVEELTLLLRALSLVNRAGEF